MRLQAQVQPEGGNTFKVDADYKGGDFSAGGYYMAGGLLYASYLQSVNNSFALGAEGIYHMLNSKARGGAGVLRCVWGGKGEHVATAKLGNVVAPNVEVTYQRRVSEKVSLATEMQYYHNQFCQFGVGYEFRLRSSTFKGLIQSDTTCSAVLEERIQPGIALNLSGQLNHKKKDYKFGVGITIGGM